MHISLSVDEAAFRDDIRKILTTKIPKDLRERYAAGAMNYPDDQITAHKILHEEGLAVTNWPVEWGGKDWTPVQRQIFTDQLALNNVPDPLAFNSSMVGPVIAEFGSQELKERFLPATAALDIWWCQGFSEPEAGSDLASLKTRAVRDGDHYIVNGQKTWTTLAQFADWIFALVRTDPDVKKQAGIGFLLIDMKSEGISRRGIQLIDGSYEVNEVFFDNVRVPVENMVGDEKNGWTMAKYLLGNERSGVARTSWTKTVVARAKEIAAGIPTVDGTLLDDPDYSRRFVQLENDLLALELTALRSVAASQEGKPSPVSSVLKLRGSQLQQAATELLADIAGTDALPTDAGDSIASPEWAQRALPRYLNTRKVSIYGGSSEVQRGIIASSILGL
ncbi:acyl-CoA dehydrogenase family protein [Williamsia sp. CHRR-6]|uniref:acyl-CoA dehydrogenase family protein n=1 Tax=Williamsia sp. CHRR-6 TaxID=2835871 RepID=UPI001BDA662A|nr:acyl-CoA dehydrogenase family protein [Williamsia sp. CHRR-6]MBT0567010.1 acyl-CoA dehydrogenase family protein [Williamsia sp. CHRR-6]